MKALVLCGGHGRRLGALCAQTPKPLLPIGGLPIVGHILHHLAAAGIVDVWVNVHHAPESFHRELGGGGRFGVNIHYWPEAELRGTAGTVGDLRAVVGDAPLLVHYGDIVTDHPLTHLVQRFRAVGEATTLLVHQRQGSNSRAWLDGDDRIVRFEERPTEPAVATASTHEPWVFSGVALVPPDVVAQLPPMRPLDLPRDVFPSLAVRGSLFAHRLCGYRCAIDSPERLAAARRASQEGTYRTPGSGMERTA